MKKTFSELAYKDEDKFVFGSSLYPVKCGFEVEIGNGLVIPEVNYTLPTMEISEQTFTKVMDEFHTMVDEILKRCIILQAPAVVLEFEHVYDLTVNPVWGQSITEDTKKLMHRYYESDGLKSALRVTVADIRGKNHPPLMRHGNELAQMLDSFQLCAKSGADIVSVESTGGKEVADKCIVECDIKGILFSVGVLGSLDMEFLWDKIVEISKRNNVVPGGDTDCAHSNTAMRLAYMKYIPYTFAALVRAIGAARSLVAFERGAIGPNKDCGYEGPILKAITGMPISMEGKSSACAHATHMGNVASAVCDLWSNESVQHTRLLGGFAPEIFSEILLYDCRLMNQAIEDNYALMLRDLMVASDIKTSPEALVIAPSSAIKIAQAIVNHKSYYRRALEAALTAQEIIRNAVKEGKLILPDREIKWLDKFTKKLEECPDDENEFVEQMCKKYQGLFIPEEYGLKT